MAFFGRLAGWTIGRRPLLLVSLGLLFAMAISHLLIAQTTTSGALVGIVTDSSNAVVPNTDVEIKDNAKGTRQSEGVYRFFFLNPARYSCGNVPIFRLDQRHFSRHRYAGTHLRDLKSDIHGDRRS